MRRKIGEKLVWVSEVVEYLAAGGTVCDHDGDVYWLEDGKMMVCLSGDVEENISAFDFVIGQAKSECVFPFFVTSKRNRRPRKIRRVKP